MKRELPSEEELTKEIKTAILHVINRSDRRIVAFSKNLCQIIEKDKKFQAVLKKAKKAGYEVVWGAQIQMSFIPAVKLEPTSETSSRSKRNGQPVKIEFTKDDERFLKAVKISIPEDEK